MIVQEHLANKTSMRCRSYVHWCTVALTLLTWALHPAKTLGEEPESLRTDPPSPQPRWRAPDKASAEGLATAAFGMPLDKASLATAELSVVQGDRTPFLWQQVNGRAVWTVRAAPFKMELKSPRGTIALKRAFDICLDAEKGHVIRISSPWPDSESFRLESPEPGKAEAHIRRASSSKYTRFVTAPPKITFSEALSIVQEKTGKVSAAIQIIGQLVFLSELGREERASWVITCRGVPAKRPTPRERDMGRRFQYRYVVDAETGELLFGTNVPRAVIVEINE